MKPIRGPIDYGGYPPRPRRNPNSDGVLNARQTPTPETKTQGDLRATDAATPRFSTQNVDAKNLKSGANVEAPNSAFPRPDMSRDSVGQHDFASRGFSPSVISTSARQDFSNQDFSNDAVSNDSASNDAVSSDTARTARLQERARRLRQETEALKADFETQAPHVVLLPTQKLFDNAQSENAAQPVQRQEDEFDRIARQSQQRHERLQARFERQALRRDRTRPAWKLVRRCTWIAAGILGAQCVGLALTQPEMQIRSVRVEGAHFTSDRVLDAAKAKFVGQNWLRASTAASQKMLEALPVVEKVRIARVPAWPPQMAISIVERTPFARVGSDSTWLVADKNGVPFRSAKASDGALEAIYDATWQPKIGVALPAEQWTRALQFVQLLAQSRAQGNAWKLRRVYFDPHGFASLRLAGGFHNETLVQLGGEEWPQKLRRAQQSLTYLEKGGRRAAVLNLITYSMPVWTPRAPLLQAKNAASSSEIVG